MHAPRDRTAGAAESFFRPRHCPERIFLVQEWCETDNDDRSTGTALLMDEYAQYGDDDDENHECRHQPSGAPLLRRIEFLPGPFPIGLLRLFSAAAFQCLIGLPLLKSCRKRISSYLAFHEGSPLPIYPRAPFCNSCVRGSLFCVKSACSDMVIGVHPLGKAGWRPAPVFCRTGPGISGRRGLLAVCLAGGVQCNRERRAVVLSCARPVPR